MSKKNQVTNGETRLDLQPRQIVLNCLNDPQKPRNPPNGIISPAWSCVSEDLAEKLVEALTQRRWPIVLTGSVGFGKTYAMACVYQSWKVHPQCPKSVLWYEAVDLLSDIIKCRTSRNGCITVSNPDGSSTDIFENGIYRKIKGAALLCLDDLGVDDATSTRRAILNRIIDMRAGKPTIITTNLGPKQFNQVFDERTYSRVFSGNPVPVDGPDRRFDWLRKVKNAVKSLTNGESVN